MINSKNESLNALMLTDPPAWFADVAMRPSAGQRASKARSLGDLARRREEHQGQFFTPTSVSWLMWSIGMTSFGGALAPPLSVFDNSIGSGRLIQFARKGDHVCGCDVDVDTVSALLNAMQSAPFAFDVIPVGMESIEASGFDLGLINPPFSVHLESPHLKPFACTTMGRYGPGSSALSHWYSLYQAMSACRVVVALMPRSSFLQLGEHPQIERLVCGVVHLPPDTFSLEGAHVETTILCLGRTPRERVEVWGLNEAHQKLEGLAPGAGSDVARPRVFKELLVDCSKPSITEPVTRNAAVRVYRSGRHLRLGFKCGLTHAKVINSLLGERLGVNNHLGNRLPRGITFAGSGRLLVEVLLVGSSSRAGIDKLCELIRDAGGIPLPDAQLLSYLDRRWKAVQVEATPLQRTVFVPGDRAASGSLDGVTVPVIKNHLTDNDRFDSPMARAGSSVTLILDSTSGSNRYRYTINPKMKPLSIEQLRGLLMLPGPSKPQDQWVQIERGRASRFPHRAGEVARRLISLGADRWLSSWKYQWDDVIEMSLTRGAIAGHMMGLGKSRIAAGCCYAGGRSNAIVVEAGLIDEMLSQFQRMGLPSIDYKVIRNVEDCAQLARINLVSYQTLRRPTERGSRRTVAHLLRRRFHTVCADEGSLLSHSETQQTRALYQLSPKRRIALDGTPVPNLPRNLLPLACWASRSATASQPYSISDPYITESLFNTAAIAERGADRFRDQFIVTEWVTHRFADSLETGGKREIPSLANLDQYRDFVGKQVLRRVWGEPDVAKHISIEDPSIENLTIDWDPGHFEHYVRTAEEFVSWWKHQRPDIASRKMNLAAVLLKLQAACRASSIPQKADGPRPWRGGLTSKQRWCIERLRQLDESGATTLCYFESPDNVVLVANGLRKLGIDTLEYTGKRNPGQRSHDLNTRYRTGQCRTMLLTFGVGSRGLNLPEASHVVFFDRMWSPRQEQQGLFRALRPGRIGRLAVIYAHLAGSVDLYKAQMVAFKQDAANAGLDFAEPEFRPDEFTHWITILDDFCKTVEMGRAELQERALNDMEKHRMDLIL